MCLSVYYSRHCQALRGLNHAGADGYHWRVRVDEKSPEGSSSGPHYSWWDIQDENARLPVKESPLRDLEKMFSPQNRVEANNKTSDDMTKAATGAIRSLGGAIRKATATGDGTSSGDPGPRVPVVAFKLLNLVKMEDTFLQKYRGGAGRAFAKAPAPQTVPQPRPARSLAPTTTQSQPTRVSVPAAALLKTRQQTAASAVPRVPPPGSAASGLRQPQVVARVVAPPPPPKQQTEASLMDFGDSPQPTLHHSTSLPTGFSSPSTNETRAQKLQKEYKKKNAKANRVWDDVDQRWVEVEPSAGPVQRSSTSAPPGSVSGPQNGSTKVVGISLDPANAIGKSANVQHAVSKRVNEMRESQQKAVQEIRERELKKKEGEAEEDEVRRKLEPKIKAWSEEHGKKKQLRALLANLHTILWPDSKWKQVSLGDLLDDNKCKRCYHRASRVVHPDKTHHLDPEKRFIAKRVFDALAQVSSWSF